MQKRKVPWFSQQVQDFNKKCKNNVKPYGTLHGLGLTVSKLHSHGMETVFLCP